MPRAHVHPDHKVELEYEIFRPLPLDGEPFPPSKGTVLCVMGLGAQLVAWPREEFIDKLVQEVRSVGCVYMTCLSNLWVRVTLTHSLLCIYVGVYVCMYVCGWLCMFGLWACALCDRCVLNWLSFLAI